MEFIVLALAYLLLAVILAVHIGTSVWSRRFVLRRRVLVSLVGDRAFTGVLWQRRGGLVVLKDAALLEPGAEPTTVDGDVLIDRSRIDYMQVI